MKEENNVKGGKNSGNSGYAPVKIARKVSKKINRDECKSRVLLSRGMMVYSVNIVDGSFRLYRSFKDAVDGWMGDVELCPSVWKMRREIMINERFKVLQWVYGVVLLPKNVNMRRVGSSSNLPNVRAAAERRRLQAIEDKKNEVVYDDEKNDMMDNLPIYQVDKGGK